MLDQELKIQVSALFEGLTSSYIFQISAAPTHPERDNLIHFLTEVAECSPNITVEAENKEGLEFTILKDGIAAPVRFQAIPTGHEFSTLLLLILNLDGKGKNFPDDRLQQRIRALDSDILLESFISLSCTNCPDVVQALNMISILNPKIQHRIIDGALQQEEADKRNIKAVPSVFSNGALLHVGRGSIGELIQKLEERFGSAPVETNTPPAKYDVIIVGGGPAGTAAAVYAARKGQSVAIIAESIGGQVLETTSIENLISVPKTTGKQLGLDLKTHLTAYPIAIFENRKAVSLSLEGGIKTITTSLGEKFSAPAVIMATGASWRRLHVPGEKEHIGTGIAFCTHCDGPLYKDKRVVVVGGGNSGLEAAIDLSGIATHVTILEFADQLKGDHVLQDKINRLPNVTVITNAETQEVIGDGKQLNGIRYKDRISSDESVIETDGIFVQIGLSPNSNLVKDIVETGKNGEIVIDAFCRTNIAGIYAAGDVSTVPYKQIIISMGEGAKAALSAFEDAIRESLL